MPNPHPKAIVFDLDGTLVDSAPDMHSAANRLLNAQSRPPITLDLARHFIGDGVARFVEQLGEATGPAWTDTSLDDAIASFLVDYEKNASVLTRPFPGVPETLATLSARGHRLAVCTNKPQTASDKLLGDLHLAAFFEVVGAGDRYGVRKPNPGHLLGTLTEMEVTPSDAMMVGDNENDAEVARATGVCFILVPYGYSRAPLNQLQADFRVGSFAEILDVVGQRLYRPQPPA